MTRALLLAAVALCAALCALVVLGPPPFAEGVVAASLLAFVAGVAVGSR